MLGAACLSVLVLAATGTARHIPDHCVFILSTPGSGSSFTVDKVQTMMGCRMSGENWGALISLGQFAGAMCRTQLETRQSQHDKQAWMKRFDGPTISDMARDMAWASLNASGASCFGFKEIRYGRGQTNRRTFAQDLDFLATLCKDPRFIFHTRASIDKELHSGIGRHGAEQFAADTRGQWRCFDAYCGVGGGNGSVDNTCAPQSGSPRVAVLRSRLEDFVADGGKLKRFLGQPRNELPIDACA